MKTQISKIKILISVIAAALILGTVGVLVWFFAFRTIKSSSTRSGAVVTNGYGCSDIGASIFKKGGSVADAAIAALFCEGVSMPQSMGLGGGFLLTIYEKETGKIRTLNARETAPGNANETIFDGNSTLSQTGGLSVAVPGELKGYWELHKEYGYLPWKDLVQPTIDLCNNGIYVTGFLAKTYRNKQTNLLNDPVLREIFIDPDTNKTYIEGQYVKRPRLSKTLEIIAKEGARALYSRNGSLIEGFVKDIQDQGGIITVADMEAYQAVWNDPIEAELSSGHTLYTSPLPGSGVLLAFILNILDGFLPSDHLYKTETFQRIIESFKFGYGRRTELGDQDFVNVSNLVHNLTSKAYAQQIRKKISDTSTSQDAEYYGAKTVPVEDHGTAQVSILAPNGDAISITSTINLVFGAGFASNTTGIILNDEMDDFSSPGVTNNFNLPPSENNYILPGKRPLSSMVPSIILKGKDVVLVTGAAGGTKITTTVAAVILKHLWYNVNLQEAIDEKRIHHQLFPMKIEYEEDFEIVHPELVARLKEIGHDFFYTPTADGFSAVTSISAVDGVVQGAFDIRRGGFISYLDR